MRLLCAFGGHEAGDEIVYDGGYYFSDCRRCGTAMVRSGACWRDVAGSREAVRDSGRHVRTLARSASTAKPVARSRGEGATRTSAGSRPGGPGSPPRDPLHGALRTNAAAAPKDGHQNPGSPIALTALIGAGLQFASSLRDLRSGS